MIALAADEVGSDHELLQVLLAAAPAVRAHPDLRAAYERAAEDLSDYEYGQAMRALGGA